MGKATETKPKTTTKAKGSKSSVPAVKKQTSQEVMDLKAYQTMRKSIIDFVREELKDGVDYGLMYDRADKPSLLKPGAEKICMLLQIEPVFIADLDTWTMMGGKEGHVNMICYLFTQKRKMRALQMIKEMGKENENTIFKMLAISEGRGAGSIGERSNMDGNSLVKIVEKRSLVDAVLRVAGLSEMYTQDGEDNKKGQQKTEPLKSGYGSQIKQPAIQRDKEKIIKGIKDMIEKDIFPSKERKQALEYLKKPRSLEALKKFEGNVASLLLKAQDARREKEQGDMLGDSQELEEGDGFPEEADNPFKEEVTNE